VGEGIIGLLDAIERFDINKANNNPRAFHNLAIVRIKSYMFQFFLANNTQYKIPTYMSRAMNLVDQIRNIVKFEDYTGDTVAAITHFDCPEFENFVAPSRRKKLMGVKGRLRNLALNSDKTYEDMVRAVIKVEQDMKDYESEEGTTSHTSPEELAGEREYMRKLLGNLNPRAKDVVTLLLGGRTLEEVGKEMNLTRERVRQIRDLTIQHLKGTPMYQEVQND
jgi:RNA polymerase sigma factor (sigma-70 family)